MKIINGWQVSQISCQKDDEIMDKATMEVYNRFHRKFFLSPDGEISEDGGYPLKDKPSLIEKHQIQKIWGNAPLLIKDWSYLYKYHLLAKYINFAACEGYDGYDYLFRPQAYFKGYIPDPWYINFQAENAGRGIDPYYIGFNTNLERIHKICEYKTQPYCSFSMYTERGKGWRYFVVAGNRQEAFEYIKDFLYL